MLLVIAGLCLLVLPMCSSRLGRSPGERPQLWATIIALGALAVEQLQWISTRMLATLFIVAVILGAYGLWCERQAKKAH
jgi:hypothetical protein